jgi:hypothetical protein
MTKLLIVAGTGAQEQQLGLVGYSMDLRRSPAYLSNFPD